MVNNSTEKEIMGSLMDRESRRVNKIKDLSTSKKIQEYPDAKKHQIVSFIKSGIRILGYILIPFSLPWAAGILVISELVGIIEELV
jgi:hypothetical protein